MADPEVPQCVEEKILNNNCNRITKDEWIGELLRHIDSHLYANSAGWSAAHHHLFSPQFRAAVRTVFLIRARLRGNPKPTKLQIDLPSEIWASVFRTVSAFGPLWRDDYMRHSLNVYTHCTEKGANSANSANSGRNLYTTVVQHSRSKLADYAVVYKRQLVAKDGLKTRALSGRALLARHERDRQQFAHAAGYASEVLAYIWRHFVPHAEEEGYRIVQGPNESFKAFVTHEWQTATAEAIGPSLDEAWAAFPTFSLPPRAGESADDVANEGQPAVLIGSDGGSIEIPAQATWMLCQLRPVLRGCTAPIKVAQLPAAVLGKVRDFCVQHHGDSRAELTEEQEILLRETPIAAWDKEFVDVDLQTLFELILAANYLNIKAMQNLTCNAVAEMIKGKSPEDIKKLFGVEGDFTEEEKAQVLAENPWLREDNEVEPPLAEEENPWLE